MAGLPHRTNAIDKTSVHGDFFATVQLSGDSHATTPKRLRTDRG